MSSSFFHWGTLSSLVEHQFAAAWAVPLFFSSSLINFLLSSDNQITCSCKVCNFARLSCAIFLLMVAWSRTDFFVEGIFSFLTTLMASLLNKRAPVSLPGCFPTTWTLTYLHCMAWSCSTVDCSHWHLHEATCPISWALSQEVNHSWCVFHCRRYHQRWLLVSFSPRSDVL